MMELFPWSRHLKVTDAYVEPFSPESVLSDISKKTRLRIGRLLVRNNYKLLKGQAVYSDSQLTSITALAEFSVGHIDRGQHLLDATVDKVIGPFYYPASNGRSEFCPVGVAIWEANGETNLE